MRRQLHAAGSHGLVRRGNLGRIRTGPTEPLQSSRVPSPRTCGARHLERAPQALKNLLNRNRDEHKRSCSATLRAGNGAMAALIGKEESPNVSSVDGRFGSAVPLWKSRVHDECHLLFQPLDFTFGCNMVCPRVDRIVLQRAGAFRRSLPVSNIGEKDQPCFLRE
jgi:hypothetical protein